MNYMSADSKLKQIRRALIHINHRATAMAQERDDESASEFKRADAVFAMDSLLTALNKIINNNTFIMALSKNERLQKLQQENKELKEKLEEFQADENGAGDDGQGDPDKQPETNGEGDQSDKLPFDLDVATNADVKEYVSDIDDIDVLEQLLDAELDGQNRKGATRAIDNRIEELAASAED